MTTQHAITKSRARHNPPTARKLITEHELAAMTGMAVSTFQKFRLFKRGPRYVKLGGAVRYDMADVERWIAANVRGGEAA